VQCDRQAFFRSLTPRSFDLLVSELLAQFARSASRCVSNRRLLGFHDEQVYMGLLKPKRMYRSPVTIPWQTNSMTKNPPLVIVGIDLAGSPKRATGLCVLRDLTAETRVVFSDEEIIESGQRNRDRLDFCNVRRLANLAWHVRTLLAE
jgi:hypothetical protein